jgi:hypothetical protein
MERSAALANKHHRMHIPGPCIIILQACYTKDRAELGSTLPDTVGGFLESTRLRYFGLTRRASLTLTDINHPEAYNGLSNARRTTNILEFMVYRKVELYYERTSYRVGPLFIPKSGQHSRNSSPALRCTIKSPIRESASIRFCGVIERRNGRSSYNTLML